MKKFITHCFIVVIAALLFTNISFAQGVASESAKNNYQLPYAGLLPDNPLYFVKALRDRIIEILISDPIKKAEFDLRSADKRLSIGIALFDKKKYELSESTISKGENYFEEGIKNLETVKKQGQAVDPSLLVAYDLSTKKHKEVIENLMERSSGEVKRKFQEDLRRSIRFIELVNKLNL